MNPFGGVSITIVDAGTEIGRGKNDDPMIVTDTTAVFNGPRAWMTQPMFDKLKAAKAVQHDSI